MKIVVDTNIIFSFFWRNSLTRKLLLSSSFELISPLLSLIELKNHSQEIIEKSQITKEEFNKEINNLKLIIHFIDKKDYSSFMEEAIKLSPDLEDVDFFALCLKYSCFFWSNDNLLKHQDKIRVLSTPDIIELLF